MPPSLRVFNGTYLARGAEVTVLEGSWQPRRLIIVRFESVAQATAWWGSDQYRAARALRQAAAVTNLIVVAGQE